MSEMAFSLFVLAILVSCGREGRTGVESSSALSKEYESPEGTLEIPADPERIVSDYYVGELLKFEVPLVGADLCLVGLGG